MRWSNQESSHQHTSNLTSKQIEIKNRVFTNVRDIDFVFASILDNSVDGQDENDELVPAQIRAADRGSVVVRSKSVVWVKQQQQKRDTTQNSDEDSDLVAYQVQSIGPTFEVVPMAGLNQQRQEMKKWKQDKGSKCRQDDDGDDDGEEEEQEDGKRSEILKEGVNRMLFLGFGLREEEIVEAFKRKTVEI